MDKSFKHQLTNVYVFFRTLINRLFYFRVSNKKVLIVLDGLIGDTVLIQNFLKECKKYFINGKGYSVDLFFSKPFVCEFFKKCCDCNGFNIIEMHYRKKEVDLKDLKQVLKFFKEKQYEYILNPMPKLKGDKITGCLKARYKFTVRDDNVITGQIFNNLFRKMAYTNTIEVPKSMMEFQRYQELLFLCDDKSYKTELPTLMQHHVSLEVPDGKYCVFSIGASEVGKRWDLNRFAEIVDYIHENYGLLIIFVGTETDTDSVNSVYKHIKHKKLIKDFTGKTNYTEWVEIIRGAVFLIGNDSASMHIAAATCTPSLCIVGEWQYKRFYPYITDIDGGIIQVIVNCGQELYCQNCGRNSYRMKNKRCKKRLESGLSLECINLIKTEFVISALEDFIQPLIKG